MIGQVIKPRVFLEGVEIDALQITIQMAIGAPSVAIIDIPPSEKFFERVEENDKGEYVKKTGVLPRTLVHVFYEDTEDPEWALDSEKGVSRLLFEGELVGYDYVKTKGSRAIRIQCRDLSNLLHSVYVRYYSDFFTPYGSLMTFFSGINKTPKAFKASIFKYAGIHPEIAVALQEDPAGVGVGNAFREILNRAIDVNSFFQSFDQRTRITKKIAVFPDEASKELIGLNLLSNLISQNLSNMKQSATVWDVYRTLMSLVFYQAVPIPAAPYQFSPVEETVNGVIHKTIPGASIMSVLMKPYTWWTAPPNFNVIFPDQIKSFSSGRSFLEEPTRLIMNAFDVIESTFADDIKQAAPRLNMFMAPEQLFDKFDQEAYDSTAAEGVTKIKDIDKGIATKQSEKDEAVKSRAAAKDDKEKKNKIDEAIKRLDEDLENAKKQRDNAVALAAKQTAQVTTTKTSEIDKEQKIAADQWMTGVLNETDNVSLASREDIKGIVFSFDNLNQVLASFTKTKGINIKEKRQYLSNVADYKLAIMQHLSRRMSMQLKFSPQLVVGFPALVVDPHRNTFGEVDSITHIFNANGSAETQVNLSLVRSDEMQFAQADRNVPGRTQYPNWINSRYLPNNIGDDVYAKVFPANGKIAAAKSILAYSENDSLFRPDQTGAGRRIRKLYYDSGDRSRFSYNFTLRNIATARQALEIGLRAVRLRDDLYIFGDPTLDRRIAVNDYANSVRADGPSVFYDDIPDADKDPSKKESLKVDEAKGEPLPRSKEEQMLANPVPIPQEVLKAKRAAQDFGELDAKFHEAVSKELFSHPFFSGDINTGYPGFTFAVSGAGVLLPETSRKWDYETGSMDYKYLTGDRGLQIAFKSVQADEVASTLSRIGYEWEISVTLPSGKILSAFNYALSDLEAGDEFNNESTQTQSIRLAVCKQAMEEAGKGIYKEFEKEYPFRPWTEGEKEALQIESIRKAVEAGLINLPGFPGLP